MLLFLILCALCLPHLGLGGNVNKLVAVVLIIVGVILVFTGWNGFTVRVD